MAQTVTLTVAQAFNTAYQAWQLSQSDPRIHHAQDKSSPSTGDRIGEKVFALVHFPDSLECLEMTDIILSIKI